MLTYPIVTSTLILYKKSKITGSIDKMKEIHQILQEKQNEFSDLKDVLNARVPILKFTQIKSGIKCDLSF